MEEEHCNGCVLVVDDVKIARDLEYAFLSKEGYEVIEASDGDEALEKFTRLHPALVILDIIMPHMNGIQALKKIKNQMPGAKVLICTATDDYRIIDLALKEGADGYIIKPYTGFEFIKAVRDILKK
jgi:two-component system chemotaxis response regulator CheY